MTVSTSDNREQYAGNDSATEFGYAFKIFKADDLVVILTATDDSETTLVRGSDYSVDGVGDESGGTVTYPLSGDPLATGETLTILREIPVVQETDLRNQGAYYPEVIEDELDRGRMIDQQQEEQLARALLKSKGGDDYEAGGALISGLGTPPSPGNPDEAVNVEFLKNYIASIESGEVGDASLVTATGTADERNLADWMKALGYPSSATGADQPLAQALDNREIWATDLAEMKALDSALLDAGTASRITTTGRAGVFRWASGDQSANVSADPQEGVWVAPDSDATGASGAWERVFTGPVDVRWFGSVDDVNSSVAIQAAIDSTYSDVIIPLGHTPQAVGLTLKNDLTFTVNGVLSLIDNAADRAKLIGDSGKTNVTIRGKGWLDGNRANQDSTFAQQLISLDNCDNFTLEGINYRHNHIKSNDLSANTLGAVKISNSRYVRTRNTYAYQCGLENLWLQYCDDSTVENHTAIGEAGWSWSGLQFSGKRNRAANIYSENAGASGISFDCQDSVAVNLVSIGSRFQNGIGFGEALPAHNTSVYGAYSEGAGQTAGEGDENGIKIQKSNNFWLFGGQTKRPTAAGISITNVASDVHLVGCRSYNAGSVGLQYADITVFTDDCYFPEGVQRIDNGESPVVGGAWEWLLSANGTNEYYLTRAGSISQPSQRKPDVVLENNVAMTRGTTGSLAAGEWNWADNDELGYKTVYVRLSDGADPDSKADGYVKVDSTPNLVSSNLILSDLYALGEAASIGDLAAGGTVVISNSNVHRNSKVTIAPSNSAGATAQPYLESVSDGSFTVGVVNASGSGASIRYFIG